MELQTCLFVTIGVEKGVVFTYVHFLSVDVRHKSDHRTPVNNTQKLVSSFVMRVVHKELTLCELHANETSNVMIKFREHDVLQEQFVELR